MKEKEFVIRLERHLRKKSVYKNKDFLDYKVYSNGEIKIYFTVNHNDKKSMITCLKDIGVENCCKIVYPAIVEVERNVEYVPFSYLKQIGVI